MALPVFQSIQLLKRDVVGARAKADALAQNTTLFMIPSVIYKQVPLSHQVEYFERDVDTMVLLLVDPRIAAMNKRYKAVYNKGVAQVSLPRYWLSGLVQHDLDEIEVWGDVTVPTRLLLRFAPARMPQRPAPLPVDFRIAGE